jgi:hypothetical protein
MSERVAFKDFTPAEVLLQINDFPGHMNRSAYLNIRLFQEHKVQNRMNGRRSQMTAKIRRTLEYLSGLQLVEKVEDRNDGLGYEWNLTEHGKRAKNLVLPTPMQMKERENDGQPAILRLPRGLRERASRSS